MNTTRQQLQLIPTPPATKTWHPIPHIELLNLVEECARHNGLAIESENHILDKGGLRYFSTLNLRSNVTDDYTTVIGLRNSHDKMFKAGVACGSHVFVCSNLCFSGEVEIGRKHTKFIHDCLPYLVNNAVEQVVEMREVQSNRFEAYKNTTMNDYQMHDFLIKSVDNGALPVTKIPHVLKLWRGENDEEWGVEHEAQFENETMWRSFNAFTSVLKGSNVFNLSNRTRRLHELSDSFCGLS